MAITKSLLSGLVAAFVISAGCLGGDPSPPNEVADCVGLADECPPSATPSCGADCAPMDAIAEPLAPTTVAVAFDGNIGQRVGACDDNAVHGCTPPVERVPYAGEAFVAANGTILGGTLTLSWTAETALTTDLGFGAMTMTPDCDGECHAAHLVDVSGPSPLTLTLPLADFVLEEKEILHLYVYPMRGSFYEADVYAYAWTGQPFNLTGAVTFQPWSPSE